MEAARRGVISSLPSLGSKTSFLGYEKTFLNVIVEGMGFPYKNGNWNNRNFPGQGFV